MYYTAELAFYGASMVMLLLWEERRHDFPVMVTHHVVTICLIAFSYSTGYDLACVALSKPSRYRCTVPFLL